MKYLNVILILLPLLTNSCSCEKNDDLENEISGPGWVAKQFYLALADGAYYDAMEYCDKSSKKDLELEYLYMDYIPDMEFVKVDSCDQYEDHAYCYCQYILEDSINKTKKLLVRNFDEIWKIHYEPDSLSAGESVLYSKKIIKNELAPEWIDSIEGVEKKNLDSVVSSSIRLLNNSDFIVGFFPVSEMYEVCDDAVKESIYDDYYIQRTVLDLINVTQTFYFDRRETLEQFKVVIMDIDSENKFGELDYLITALVKEFGHPYNAEGVLVEDLYKYKEVKWFLQGYNEELIISNEYQNITISLVEAY